MPQSETVVIDRRFRGPPTSANGGYACGLLGVRLGPSADVSLRLPPPLETPLHVQDGRLLDDEQRVVAEGQAVELDVQPPPAPSVEEVRAAPDPDMSRHPFPGCYVCGPDRAPGDGLRLYGRPVPGFEGVAAVWNVEEAPEPLIVWAAMDCLTAGACDLQAPSVLARLGVALRAPVQAGPHVIHSWPTATDGRKHFSEEALYDGEGNVLAVARALWIELRDPSAFQAHVA